MSGIEAIRHARIWALGIALALAFAVAAARDAAPPAPPSELYGDLFVAVQTSGLFADSKQFADAIGRGAPQEIVAAWNAQRGRSGFSLRDFVQEHFEIEAPVETPESSEALDLCRHIDRLWDELTREMQVPPRGSSLLALSEPALVPGGRFREVYYWDSYFSLLGVAQSGRHVFVERMVRNFADLIDRYGHVPNGTRSYYLSRSQPPFFHEMLALTAPEDPAAAYARHLPQLRREHAFWMDGERQAQPRQPYRRVVALGDGLVLNRYWDDRPVPRDESYREDVELARRVRRPAESLYRDIRAAAESGWDFSSRWLADGRSLATLRTTELVPIDLNSLLHGLEDAIRLGCERSRDAACVDAFTQRAAARRIAIHRFLWDRGRGAFVDYDWRRRRPSDQLSAAALYPLFAGLAEPEQARAVARVVRARLLQAGGLAATDRRTGEQWDLPNGWAPLHWIAVRGLRQYGETALAETIAERWLSGVERVYHASGKLVEKYDVVDLDRPGGGGEYPLQDGFGWTNGVTVALWALYPQHAPDCAGTSRRLP